MDKDKLREAAKLLAIDALVDEDGIEDVFQELYSIAARILSLLASGEWEMVPRQMTPAMFEMFENAGTRGYTGTWTVSAGSAYNAFLAAAPDPLEES